MTATQPTTLTFRRSVAPDALSLVPTFEQGFVTERWLGELVNSCVVERA